MTSSFPQNRNNNERVRDSRIFSDAKSSEIAGDFNALAAQLAERGIANNESRTTSTRSRGAGLGSTAQTRARTAQLIEGASSPREVIARLEQDIIELRSIVENRLAAGASPSDPQVREIRSRIAADEAQIRRVNSRSFSSDSREGQSRFDYQRELAGRDLSPAVERLGSTLNQLQAEYNQLNNAPGVNPQTVQAKLLELQEVQSLYNELRSNTRPLEGDVGELRNVRGRFVETIGGDPVEPDSDIIGQDQSRLQNIVDGDLITNENLDRILRDNPRPGEPGRPLLNTPEGVNEYAQMLRERNPNITQNQIKKRLSRLFDNNIIDPVGEQILAQDTQSAINLRDRAVGDSRFDESVSARDEKDPTRREAFQDSKFRTGRMRADRQAAGLPVDSALEGGRTPTNPIDAIQARLADGSLTLDTPIENPTSSRIKTVGDLLTSLQVDQGGAAELRQTRQTARATRALADARADARYDDEAISRAEREAKDAAASRIRATTRSDLIPGALEELEGSDLVSSELRSRANDENIRRERNLRKFANRQGTDVSERFSGYRSQPAEQLDLRPFGDPYTSRSEYEEYLAAGNTNLDERFTTDRNQRLNSLLANGGANVTTQLGANTGDTSRLPDIDARALGSVKSRDLLQESLGIAALDENGNLTSVETSEPVDLRRPKLDLRDAPLLEQRTNIYEPQSLVDRRSGRRVSAMYPDATSVDNIIGIASPGLRDTVEWVSGSTFNPYNSQLPTAVSEAAANKAFFTLDGASITSALGNLNQRLASKRVPLPAGGIRSMDELASAIETGIEMSGETYDKELGMKRKKTTSEFMRSLGFTPGNRETMELANALEQMTLSSGSGSDPFTSRDSSTNVFRRFGVMPVEQSLALEAQGRAPMVGTGESGPRRVFKNLVTGPASQGNPFALDRGISQIDPDRDSNGNIQLQTFGRSGISARDFEGIKKRRKVEDEMLKRKGVSKGDRDKLLLGMGLPSENRAALFVSQLDPRKRITNILDSGRQSPDVEARLREELREINETPAWLLNAINDGTVASPVGGPETGLRERPTAESPRRTGSLLRFGPGQDEATFLAYDPQTKTRREVTTSVADFRNQIEQKRIQAALATNPNAAARFQQSNPSRFMASNQVNPLGYNQAQVLAQRGLPADFVLRNLGSMDSISTDFGLPAQTSAESVLLDRMRNGGFPGVDTNLVVPMTVPASRRAQNGAFFDFRNPGNSFDSVLESIPPISTPFPPRSRGTIFDVEPSQSQDLINIGRQPGQAGLGIQPVPTPGPTSVFTAPRGGAGEAVSFNSQMVNNMNRNAVTNVQPGLNLGNAFSSLASSRAQGVAPAQIAVTPGAAVANEDAIRGSIGAQARVDLPANNPATSIDASGFGTRQVNLPSAPATANTSVSSSFPDPWNTSAFGDQRISSPRSQSPTTPTQLMLPPARSPIEAEVSRRSGSQGSSAQQPRAKKQKRADGMQGRFRSMLETAKRNPRRSLASAAAGLGATAAFGLAINNERDKRAEEERQEREMAIMGGY